MINPDLDVLRGMTMSSPVKIPYVSAELIFLKIALYTGIVAGYVAAGSGHFEGLVVIAICVGTLALIATVKERDTQQRQA